MKDQRDLNLRCIIRSPGGNSNATYLEIFKKIFPQKNFLEERVRWGAEGQILYPEEIEMAQLHTTPPLLGFLTMHHCTVL